MATLKSRIIGFIEQSGPISIAEYMTLCLTDPEHGYYTTKQPFGTDGDFITAPEVSQMFGELIGAWVLETWTHLGKPDPFHLVEMGPGRGTLMKDILRVAKLDAAFEKAISLHLVEISPELQEQQRKTLSQYAYKPSWHETITDVPDGPFILIGNEFLDALPFRQFVKTEQGWFERVVTEKENELTFAIGAAMLAQDEIPNADDMPLGSIFEIAPAREAFVEEIATRVAAHNGAALLIDYGHTSTAVGDTFQAVANQTYCDPLTNPGLADLTSHVDFEALTKIVHRAGAAALPPMSQREFLLSLGLLERAGSLGSDKSPQVRDTIMQAVQRLAGPDDMGNLFKAMAIAPADVHLPPFPAPIQS